MHDHGHLHDDTAHEGRDDTREWASALYAAGALVLPAGLYFRLGLHEHSATIAPAMAALVLAAWFRPRATVAP